MTQFGSGPPLVVVPGIQGRWEWMTPAIQALAVRHTVHTFSLGMVQGERLFDQWAEIIDQIAARHGGSVAVVGISFGGLVAAYYAGRHPDRVHHLVLASAPSPSWRLDARSARYVARPRLSLPLFAARGAVRLHHEVRTALPALGSRIGFTLTHLGRVVRYPASAVHMASCVQAWRTTDLPTFCRHITAPTLVITGEPHLDRVVPVESSLEYLSLVPNARHTTLPRTGHLGLVLRPRDFAALVTDFVHDGSGPTAAADDGRHTHGARDAFGTGRAPRGAPE